MQLSTEARRYRSREQSELLSPKRRAVLRKLLQARSPQEQEILEQNKRLRQDAARTIRSGQSIALELSIPERHLRAIKHMIPELRDSNPDKEARVKAWKRFLGDSISRPYRVA